MSNWTLSYDHYVPEEEMRREALTSTGNGYFCTRGACEWSDCGPNHYPGTFMHGGFNRAVSIIGGRPVSNEDLVNLPNWLPLKLRIENDEPFSLENVEILSYNHSFDIRRAVVSRTIRFRDKKGRETTLASRRFVSMHKMHMAAIEWVITPENWSGEIEVISALDGRVVNWGVPVYHKFESKHLRPVRTGPIGSDGISLIVQTSQSRIYIAQAARTNVFVNDEKIEPGRSLHMQDDYIQQTLTFTVREKTPVRIEKIVALYSSKDQAISEPLAAAQIAVCRWCDFGLAYERQEQAWDQLWAMSDFKLPGDPEAQMLLRFNTAHILMCCSRHSADIDAAAPARGLTGEHYHGRMFWDEMYIYPFLNYRMPEITRGLLMYRNRRLDEARERAREAGYSGAMFPWQSGSDGREETHLINFNERDGKWYPDYSFNQRHVNAAIFYNMWQYFQATRDLNFLWNHGARLMIEVARLFASLAKYNPDRGRYEIHGVMGPDEYHEKYHDSEEHGVKNNAYTNIMAAWMFSTVIEALDLFPKKRRKSLCAILDLTDEEITKWEDMSAKMFVPFHDEGIISQFEGYEKLAELDWDAYRKKYGNLYRLDFILKAEGDTAEKYKVSKQADTLMLFYLFSESDLKALFARLGYKYGEDTMRRNIEYYYQRCSHCSTLSLIVHADIMADIDPQRSWDMFKKSLRADVDDIQGGTTPEGIHMGIMAGTLDLMQRGFMGMEVRDDTLYFAPKPLPELEGLSFQMVYRNTPLRLKLENQTLKVSIEDGEFGQPTMIGVGDDVIELQVGDSHSFALERSGAKTRVA